MAIVESEEILKVGDCIVGCTEIHPSHPTTYLLLRSSLIKGFVQQTWRSESISKKQPTNQPTNQPCQKTMNHLNHPAKKGWKKNKQNKTKPNKKSRNKSTKKNIPPKLLGKKTRKLHSGKTNIALENGPDISYWKWGIFQPAMLIYQRVTHLVEASSSTSWVAFCWIDFTVSSLGYWSKTSSFSKTCLGCFFVRFFERCLLEGSYLSRIQMIQWQVMYKYPFQSISRDLRTDVFCREWELQGIWIIAIKVHSGSFAKVIVRLDLKPPPHFIHDFLHSSIYQVKN